MKETKRIGNILAVLLFAMLVIVSTGNGAEQSSGEVPDSPEKITPLPVGAQVPKITLKTVDGKAFDLNAAIAEKPTILIFYRGGW